MSNVNDLQVTYQVLDDLFDGATADIEDIETQISAIQNANTTYEQYIDTINQYSAYEDVVTQRLEQLDTFLNDTAQIDGQETLMSNLESDMNAKTQAYSELVSSNNLAASRVQTAYSNVINVISQAAADSGQISLRRDQYQALIAQKRSNAYVGSKYVLLTAVGTVGSPQSRLSGDKVVFNTVSMTLIPTAARTNGYDYHSGYGIEYNSSSNTFRFNPSAHSPTAPLTITTGILNVEVLGTSLKPTFDKVSSFSLEINSVARVFDASKTGHLQNVNIPSMAEFSIKANQNVSIRSMVVSLQI